MARTTPLCSNMYRFMFNSTRIPALPSDVTRVSPFHENHHLIVMRKNRFFTVDLILQGTRLSTTEIQTQLTRIIDMAGPTKAPALGAYTTEHRDTWTQIREELILDPLNASSLDMIERGVMILCLDSTSPVTKVEASRECWHGDGQNRFFDKSLQFIVFENGKAGFNGEHSMMDATAPSRLCEYVCER